jgi:hypothetical protein
MRQLQVNSNREKRSDRYRPAAREPRDANVVSAKQRLYGRGTRTHNLADSSGLPPGQTALAHTYSRSFGRRTPIGERRISCFQ